MGIDGGDERLLLADLPVDGANDVHDGVLYWTTEEPASVHRIRISDGAWLPIIAAGDAPNQRILSMRVTDCHLMWVRTREHSSANAEGEVVSMPLPSDAR